MLGDTIPQVEVNECLVGDAGFFGHGFEVFHGIVIQTDGDRLFSVFDVGVTFPLHIGEVVMFSHGRLLQ